jgi:epoxyqueuosine reductase QueG
VPRLLDLLGAEYLPVIRRNAAIALGNIARGRQEAIEALARLTPTVDPHLEPYFQWALERVSGSPAER